MIDLSHPVVSGMAVYPGDPDVRIDPALTIADDGVAVAALSLGSHSGTHLDAPAHVVPGGRTVDQVRLDELVGEALVLHLADRVREGRWIDTAALGLDEAVAVPSIVVVRTGWDRWFGASDAPPHPYLCPDAARYLLALGMRVLAIDAPSPDRAPAPGAQSDLSVHEAVLGSDGLIVENLRGLEQLSGRDRVRIGIFPLPLAGGDGAPARVVAWP